MKETKIEWCDHTFNPWWGCSLGCGYCYAARLNARFKRCVSLVEVADSGERESVPDFTQLQLTSVATWKQPVAWNREAARGREVCGSDWVRPRVFCGSMCDWLEPTAPATWLGDLLALIAATPELDWLLLTKRPELWRGRMDAAKAYYCGPHIPMIREWVCGKAPRNVWLGTTVTNQADVYRRVEELQMIPARVCFLSLEPLLEPIRLRAKEGEKTLTSDGDGMIRYAVPPHTHKHGRPDYMAYRIDWVIAGPETGAGARPCDAAWFDSLADECEVAKVPFFDKRKTGWLRREWPKK